MSTSPKVIADRSTRIRHSMAAKRALDWHARKTGRFCGSWPYLERTRAGLDYSNVQRVIQFPPGGRWPRKEVAA